MGSVFSKIVAGTIPCHKVAETALSLAFLDIGPLREAHTLVIPKREVQYVKDLNPEELADLMVLAAKVRARQTQVLGVPDATIFVHDGPRAGQEVPHVHIHLVPIANRAAPVHTLLGGPGPTNHEQLANIAAKLREN